MSEGQATKEAGAIPSVVTTAAISTAQVNTVGTVVAESQETLTVPYGMKLGLEDILARDVLLQVVSIADTDVNGALFFGVYDLFAQWLANPLVALHVRNYGNIRFDIHLRVVMSVPSSCAGCYCVTPICEGGNTSAAQYVIDAPGWDVYYTCCQDTHGFLNCEISNTLEFDLPWVHFNDSVDMIPGPSAIMCWRLQMYCLSALQSSLATGVTGSVQYYAHARNVVLQNTFFQGKKKGDKEHFDKHYPVVKEKPAVPTNSYSSYGKMMAQGLSYGATVIPAIAPLAMPVAAGLSVISSIAEMFGFTRESAPSLPVPRVIRNYSSIANADSQDSSEIVALSVANATSIDPRVGGGTDEDPMAFDSLFCRFTMLDRVTLTTSAARGAILTYIPVTPFFGGGTSTTYNLPVAGYIGMPFQYWRGGMEYLIYIPSTSNFEGKLKVMWDPTTTVPPAYTNDPTNYLSNTSINLHGSSRTMVRIGYSDHRPCLSQQISNSATRNVPNGGARDGSHNGWLVFFLEQPLTSSRATAVHIDILIMARATSDMRFGVPSVQQGISTVTFQGGTTDEVAEHVVDLVPVGDPYPTTEVLWGEDIKSVRMLMQAFSGCSVLGDNSSTFVQHIPFGPNSTATPNMNGVSTPSFCYLSWYAPLFTGVRGSVRWKVMPADEQATTILIAWPVGEWYGIANNSPTYNWGCASLWNYDSQSALSEQGNGTEWLFPYYFSRKYINPRECWDPTVAVGFLRNIRMNGVSSPNGTTGQLWPLFIAGGPDITANRFRRVPGLFYEFG